MTNKFVLSATLLFAASLANASTFNFSFVGGGVSGFATITYGSATDAKYPTQAYEVTGISGNFSDANLNIASASITGLQAITHSTPESTNLAAPNDFSRFPVLSGLSPQEGGNLTFDNLFYPAGSPPTATDYTVHGGFLDIYGLMFTIGNGRVVDLWSNGDFTGTGNGPIDYGVAVATSSVALDYVGNGVSITPEPGPLSLLGAGLVALLLWQRRLARQ